MKILCLSAVMVLSFAGHAQEMIHSQQLSTKLFPKGSSCALKKFSVATYDREFKNFGDTNSTSRNMNMAASWETTDPSCVKEYGVVQYIRGCIYNIEFDPRTGAEKKYFGVTRRSRGENVIFKHSTWVVDSIDIDPLYSSYNDDDANESNRFDWHKFSNTRLLLKPDKNSLLKDENKFFNSKNYSYLQDGLKGSSLFVTDLPTGSDYRPKGALGRDWINVSSLEFKTCLYHTKDIPMTGDPASFEMAEKDGGPIVCYDWSDKMKVDYKKKNFQRTDDLDPLCH